MKRPIKNDYLTTNQFTYHERLNKYYDELEKYVDYLEQVPMVTLDGKDIEKLLHGNSK